jgi:hypothetical protein
MGVPVLPPRTRRELTGSVITQWNLTMDKDDLVKRLNSWVPGEPVLCSQGAVPYNKAHLDAKDAQIQRLSALFHEAEADLEKAAAEIERLKEALDEIAGMTLQPAFKINRMTLVTAIKVAKTALETSGTGGDEQRSREGTSGAE